MTGRTIAHYRLFDTLGQGAGGAVYRAEDTRLGRTVALKLLRNEAIADPDLRRRFLQEARAASSLQHPNLCTVHDLGETDDGQLYIAMAYYEGGSLAERLVGGALAPDDAARITAEVAAGLAHAHAAGIVHRDLKPANIMFDGDDRAVVVDFGVARLMDSETLTEDGSLLGTLFYMSPEQVRGEAVGPASDVWSLGVVLYEMLTGERPFQGESAGAVLAAIVEREVEVPDVARRASRVGLGEILANCLEKDVALRRVDAAAVYDALSPISNVSNENLTNDARTLVLPSSGGRTRVGWARGAFGIVLGAAVLLAVGVLGIQRGWFGDPARPGIVILPPVVLGGDATDRAFADGLINHLTASLALLEPAQDGAWIIPAIDVRYNDVTGIEASRSRLGANTVLTSTLHIQGDRLRLEFVRHETLPGWWIRQAEVPESVRIPGSRAASVSWLAEIESNLQSLLGWRKSAPGQRLPGGTHVSSALNAYLVGLGYIEPYAGERMPAEARVAFDKAVATDINFAWAFSGLAASLRRGGGPGGIPDPEQALAESDRAAEVAPDLVDAHLQRGAALLDLGRAEEAMEAFASATWIVPGHAVALHYLGRALADNGHLAAADSVLALGVEKRPAYAAAHADRGVFLLKTEQYEAAIPVLRRALEIAPAYMEGLVNLGNAYFYLDRWTEAETAYQRALAVAPDAFAYQNLGTIFFYKQRYLDAAQMYEQAIEMNPDDYFALSWCAECYHWSRNDLDLAQRYWKRAAAIIDSLLAVYPQEIGLKIDLASCLAMTGRDDDAATLVAAVLPAVDDEQQWFKVAAVQEQIGDRSGALRSLDRALAAGMPAHFIGRYPGLERLQASVSYPGSHIDPRQDPH